MRSKSEAEAALALAEEERRRLAVQYDLQLDTVEAIGEELFKIEYLEQARAGQRLQTPEGMLDTTMAKGCIAIAWEIEKPVVFNFNQFVITVYPDTILDAVEVDGWPNQLSKKELAEEAFMAQANVAAFDRLLDGGWKIRNTFTHPE